MNSSFELMEPIECNQIVNNKESELNGLKVLQNLSCELDSH
jgi:hypothetical protein